jgi:hypothetical protein
MAAVVRPRFYPVFGIALALVVLTGFARTLYLRYWFDVPPIQVITLLHGTLFTAWMILFIVQARLIAANNVRAHMRLGAAGVVLAALVFVLGLITAVASASAPRLRPMGMTSPQFVFVPIFLIFVFGALVTAAVLQRRRTPLHKRLMTLAMIALLPPAVARLILLSGTTGHFVLLQTSVTALFVLCCVLYDGFKYRMLHPVYAVGGTLLVLSWPFRAWVAGTDAWGRVGRWLASLSGS